MLGETTQSTEIDREGDLFKLMLLFAWRYQMYQKVEGFSHQCEEIAVTILQSSAVCRVSHDVG